MDRIFLDAKVLFSASYREDNGLLRLWTLPDAELITSSFALDEVARNLTSAIQHERLNNLLANLRIVPTASDQSIPANVALPEKDVPILLAAIGASATHLLTGDKRHFGPLFGQTLDGVMIQPLADYLMKRTAPDEGPQDDSSV